MNLRGTGRRDSEPEIILTALVDVILILLIFFVATTTFNRQTELGIQLPRSSAEATPEKNAIEIAVDVQGHYYVNGKALGDERLETLKRALQQGMGSGDRPPLTVSADGRTPHQAVVTALDAANQLGFARVAIVTRRTP
jgi:biopolymer transport protein ExbD